MHPAHGDLGEAEEGRVGVRPEGDPTVSGHRGDSFVIFLFLFRFGVSNNVFLLVLYSSFYCLGVFFARYRRLHFLSWMQLILCSM